MPTVQSGTNRVATTAIIAAALGYFVDVYDIWLFAVLRNSSLKSLGFTSDQDLKSIGEFLLNTQMLGFVLGAIFFGVLSDKKGRLTVLFGSILTYSLANLANAFVHDVNTYAICRFFAGMGLAGELGAGIALVSELVPKDKRGWATTLVATVGVFGSVAAAKTATNFDWRVGYMIGGGMGLALLVFRFSVFESGMFNQILEQPNVRRGDFGSLFRNSDRLKRYTAIVLAGLPVWYFAALFQTFSPELQKGLAIQPAHAAPDVILIGSIGLTVGDLLFGGLSQIVKSRKGSMLCALALMAVAITAIFTVARDRDTFYWLMFVAGVGAGYWSVFVTTASELFGTNLRGTVAITAPSFVRGLVVPLTILRTAMTPQTGLIGATQILGVVVLIGAVVSVLSIRETYGTDLEYVESS